MPPSVLPQVVLSLALLGAIEFAAIGASGLLAWGLGSAVGKDFIAGDTQGTGYTVARCADFLRFHPEAGDCLAAATAHHYDEVIGQRVDAGILGLLGLAALALLRRRYPRFLGVRLVPPVLVPAMFGFVAALLLFDSTGRLVFSGASGVGANLTGGSIAAGVALFFLAWFIRSLRRSLPDEVRVA